MLPSLALPIFLTLPTASAQSPAKGSTVLVSPFQAKTRAASSTATSLTMQVQQALSEVGGLGVTAVDSLPPVSEMRAATYAATCPPGQFVGCAFVLGDAGEVSVTVAAAVETVAGRHRVEVHIIDMDRSEDVLAFDADFDAGDEAGFATALARLVSAVVRGEAGLKQDIRAKVDPTANERAERERTVANAQLDALSREIGGSSDVTGLEKRQITREKLSLEAMAEGLDAEGSKPWERLDMTVNEYVRYHNSGLSLPEWRKRAAGRRLQVIIRGAIGYGRGPFNGQYYALQARAADNLEVVETYAFQTANAGNGVGWEATGAFGITPTLEVGLRVGGASGRFELQSWSLTEGQDGRVPDPLQTGNSVWHVGPQALVALMPTSSVRPVVGGEFDYWKGTGVDSHVDQLDPDLPRFKAPWLLSVGGRVGVEARMGNNLDLFLHVPISVIVAGKEVARSHEGSGYLAPLEQPPALAPFGAAIQVGVQTRFLGGKQARPKETFDEPI